jgi:hypothetical protein
MVYGADQFKYEGKEAPAHLLQKLETAGIPTKWVSEDVRAKELFDITTDRVPLINIPLTVRESREGPISFVLQGSRYAYTASPRTPRI